MIDFIVFLLVGVGDCVCLIDSGAEECGRSMRWELVRVDLEGEVRCFWRVDG